MMNPNPYESPKASIEPPSDIVDRTQRDALAALVRRYLDEEITAFQFDNQLADYLWSSDSAVRFVAQELWYGYDDLDDHLVALSKADWDYFQRLLLLLESECCVQSTHSRRWLFSQVVALAALLGFIYAAFQLGWGYRLLLVAAPFGLVSIGISLARSKSSLAGTYDQIIYPFATFSELKSAYDAVAFKKTRYPRRLHARRIRSPFMNAFYQVQFYAGWLLLSPIALIAQIFPATETKTRVIAGAPPNVGFSI